MTWAIGGDLGSGYTPPLSPGIGGDLYPPAGQIAPFGFDAAEWGDALVGNKSAYPFGIYDLAFGQAIVSQTQSLAPSAFSADTYGVASVQNWVRYLTPAGIAGAIGNAAVFNVSLGVLASGWDSLVTGPAESPHSISYYRAVIETSGFDALATDSPAVTDGIRFLRPSPTLGEFGVQLVTNFQQTARPIGFRTDEFGTPEAGVSRTLLPFGFDGLRTGTTRVKDDRQSSAVEGIAGAFGLPAGRNYLNFLRPEPAALGGSFGGGTVFNRTQQVFVYWPADHVAGPVASPTFEMQDKQASPLGFDALRFAPLGPTVNLGYPPVEASAGMTAEFGFAMAAPRIRTVTTFGRSMDTVSKPLVANAAQSVTPVPFQADEHGRPEVLNLLQIIPRVIGISSLEMWTPFVAPRVRTLIPTGWFSFEAGRQHQLGLSPRYLLAFSISGAFGLASVQNRPVLTIGVRQDQPGTVGRPAAINRTRSVFPAGDRSDAHGTPDIRNYLMFLAMPGFEAMTPGVHAIGPRVREARPVAISGSIGFHRARLIPEPPQPQYVDVSGVEGSVGTGHFVVGTAISPAGFAELAFGTPAAAGDGIFPRGFNDLQMEGVHNVISYQTVFPFAIDELPEWGLGDAPRISPYTVWAPEGAPAQANINHPPGLSRPIGIQIGEGVITGGVVPEPFVSNWMRTVFHVSSDNVEFGNATLIQPSDSVARPLGFRGRWGFPFVLGGVQRRLMSGADTSAFGEADVSRPGDFNNTISPAGIAGEHGAPSVSGDPHDILPSGVESLLVSNFSWVSHEYPPFLMTGFDATQWGAAWVSTNPQVIHPFGWDSFVSEPVEIRDRMRVKARAFVSPFGFQAAAYGTAWVERGQRTVTAFSVFHNSVPAPRVQLRVAAEGIAPLIIPEPVVDQVEAGVLKAKGSAHEDFGLPAISAAIRAIGIAGQVGAVGVYNRLGPQGWSGAFGDALVSGDDDHTCGMLARGVRHVWNEDDAFGDAEVVNG